MKTTTFFAILLTLLSLLLVAGAASLFLLQGRGALEEEVRNLQDTVQNEGRTIDNLQATIEAQEAALTSSEATLASNEATLAETSLQLAAREDELNEALAALEAFEGTGVAQPPTTSEPPVIEIVNPQFGVPISSDAPLPIIVVAIAGEGVERIEIAVGDRERPFSESGNGEPFRVMRRNVFNLAPGSLMITATLTTVDNQVEQTTMQVIVSGETPEEEAEDTQGLLSAPVVDLRR